MTMENIKIFLLYLFNLNVYDSYIIVLVCYVDACTFFRKIFEYKFQNNSDYMKSKKILLKIIIVIHLILYVERITLCRDYMRVESRSLKHHVDKIVLR